MAWGVVSRCVVGYVMRMIVGRVHHGGIEDRRLISRK